ncbi:MAG: tetratricopeptide repeat protein [Pseudomonadota bacterium]
MSYNEDETVEQIKAWWARYGTPVLLSMAVVLLSFSGWRYWSTGTLEDATQAQALQQQMTSAMQRVSVNSDDKAANTDLQRLGQQLIAEYAKTPYAVDAALLLAKRAVDSGDLAAAEKQLRTALDLKPSAEIKLLVQTRLARVLAARKQYPAALAVLDDADADAAAAPLVAEIRGDILLLQGQRDAAAKAYVAADAALAARDEARPLLDLKLADVGMTPARRASDLAAEVQP